MNLGYYMDVGGRSHTATLVMPGDDYPQPKVEISGLSGHPSHTYHAASLVDCARRGRSFRVENGFGDAIGVFELPAGEVQRLAKAIEGSIPGPVGVFHVTWVPADPRSPF